ncbi:hypothetical protein [Streptomyces sp. NPDC050548]|uniref:hypothetical protein n=1 Tax=Streptomyces sp. NPDC050548 TaxID=3365629 RepID=UPI0037BCDFA9
MHERVHRINQGRNWLGRWRDRALDRLPRPIGRLSDLAGESLAEWALKNVLHAPKRPVPSFGFGLAPVLTHSIAARRQLRIRQALLAGVAAVVAVRHPGGTMALAAGMLLYQLLIATGRGRRILGWGASSLVSMVLLVGGIFLLWTQVRPFAPFIRPAVVDAIPTAVELAAAVTAVYVLDRWVALAYLESLSKRHDGVATRPHLAPRAAKRIAECETAEAWASVAYRSNDGIDRFVGAGLDAWRSGATRIQLAPARTKADAEEDEDDSPGHDVDDAEPSIEDEDAQPGGMRTFEADELLDRVRDELEALRGVLVETHALPNCDVAEVLAVPQSRWKTLPRAPEATADPADKQGALWPEAHEMITQGRLAPSGHASRRYLSAQVISWEGQVVVTVFAHAALEGKTLHFVTRPHILAPLNSDASAESAAGRELAGKVLLVPLHALGDTFALAHRIYGVVGRGLGLLKTSELARAAKRQAAQAMEPDKDDKRPVSLREHCTQTSPLDMHQAEDAYRHISILQSRMFSTVTAFLSDHGLAVGEFQRQAAQITHQWFVDGDHNQINTGKIGGDQVQQQQQQQSDGAKAKG